MSAKKDQTALNNMISAILEFNKGYEVDLTKVDIARLNLALDVCKYLADEIETAGYQGDDSFTFEIVHGE